MKTLARLTANKTALNFWFAIVLLFILTMVMAYANIQLHQTLGQAMAVRLRQVKRALRLKIALDIGLLVGYTLLVMSGLIIMFI